MELEDGFDGGVEGAGDAEGQDERGDVFVGFEGDDGLTGDADSVGEILLRHPVVFKASALTRFVMVVVGSLLIGRLLAVEEEDEQRAGDPEGEGSNGDDGGNDVDGDGGAAL